MRRKTSLHSHAQKMLKRSLNSGDGAWQIGSRADVRTETTDVLGRSAPSIIRMSNYQMVHPEKVRDKRSMLLEVILGKSPETGRFHTHDALIHVRDKRAHRANEINGTRYYTDDTHANG
jgi:hypothetical protein